MTSLSSLHIELFEKLVQLKDIEKVFYFYPNQYQAKIFPRINFVFENITSQTLGNDIVEPTYLDLSIGFYNNEINYTKMDEITALVKCLENGRVIDILEPLQVYDVDNNIYGLIYTYSMVLIVNG